MTLFRGFGKGGAKTGTYAMRNGKLELVSEKFDGVDGSARLDTRTTMWTELPRHMNPAGKKWKKWTKGKQSFPIVDGDAERRDYQAMCKDAGYHREWTK